MALKFSNGAGNQFVSRELLPIKAADRKLSAADVGLIWGGIAIDITTFAVAMSYYPDMSPKAILLASVVGYFVVSVMLALTGDVGLTYGITYSVTVRASFGYMGTHVAGLIRAFPCWFWLGFQTWIAAYSMNAIMEMMTGFSNLWIMIILFTFLQTLNAALGMKAMARVDWLAIPLLAIALAVIMGHVLTYYHSGIAEVLFAPTPDAVNSPAMFSACVIGMLGGYITLTLNTMDFTRSMKVPKDFNQRGIVRRNFPVFFGAFIGMTCVAMLITIMGLTCGLLSGTWNPVDYSIEVFSDKPVIMTLCFLAIVFATWSTNMTTNITPAANVTSNINPKYITYAAGCFIAGALSLLMFPWKWDSQMGMVQVFISNMLGPIAFIIITDYFILRKRKYNVPALFNPNGQYKYAKNYNPAALITLALALALSFIIDIRISFWLQIPFTMIVYYVLMKYWICKKYPQEELEDPNYVPDYEYDGSDLGIELGESNYQ